MQRYVILRLANVNRIDCQWEFIFCIQTRTNSDTTGFRGIALLFREVALNLDVWKFNC